MHKHVNILLQKRKDQLLTHCIIKLMAVSWDTCEACFFYASDSSAGSMHSMAFPSSFDTVDWGLFADVKRRIFINYQDIRNIIEYALIIWIHLHSNYSSKNVPLTSSVSFFEKEKEIGCPFLSPLLFLAHSSEYIEKKTEVQLLSYYIIK